MDFEKLVIEKLGKIERHVEKTNGSIADVQKELNDHELENTIDLTKLKLRSGFAFWAMPILFGTLCSIVTYNLVR